MSTEIVYQFASNVVVRLIDGGNYAVEVHGDEIATFTSDTQAYVYAYNYASEEVTA